MTNNSDTKLRFPLEVYAIPPIFPCMGLRIRQLREEARLSLRDLAKAAGVDFSTIHRIEVGTEEPRLGTLGKLAKALGVSIRDLIEK